VWIAGELRWKVEVVEVEREMNEEGVTLVTHVETPLPPNDNGRGLYQE